jgi:XTP/dITP diphosphohydrolase
MNEIVISTNNHNKLKELSSVFGSGIKLMTLKEVNFHEKIIEDGKTFIENSLKKCIAFYDKIKKPVMADDSGICVAALDGAPGIFSARYGGDHLSDKERYEHLLHAVKDKKDLNASFVCALVLYINPNRIYIVQEETKGLITFEPKGSNGFGYDPIFYLPELKKTAAELTDSEKNEVSHRGKAAREMKKIIDSIDLLS